jgi:hypothetical protein
VDQAVERDGSDRSEAETSCICAEPGCGQQVLLVELNEHEEMHEAERLTLDSEDEPSSQSSRMNDATAYHQSTLMLQDSSSSNFSTAIPPALRREDNKRSRPRKLQRDPNHPGQHMGRRFLSAIGFERSRRQETSTPSARLGVSSLLNTSILTRI